jgi:hypothetical protein
VAIAAQINMQMSAVDADGDAKPGFTATSRNDTPYVPAHRGARRR